MEIIKGADAPEASEASNRPVDYDTIVSSYNRMHVGDVARLGYRVTNITLFKKALERRKVKSGADFLAYNTGDSCYIKRLSNTIMEG